MHYVHFTAQNASVIIEVLFLCAMDIPRPSLPQSPVQYSLASVECEASETDGQDGASDAASSTLGAVRPRCISRLVTNPPLGHCPKLKVVKVHLWAMTQILWLLSTFRAPGLQSQPIQWLLSTSGAPRLQLQASMQWLPSTFRAIGLLPQAIMQWLLSTFGASGCSPRSCGYCPLESN